MDIPNPPKGLTWLTPFLWVPDVPKAIDFYTRVFGFECTFQLAPETGEEMLFARLRWRDVNITVNREGSFQYAGKAPVNTGVVSGVSFYMYVDDVDDFFAKVKADTNVLEEPQLMFWGDCKCRLQDPFGFIWDFATAVKRILG